MRALIWGCGFVVVLLSDMYIVRGGTSVPRLASVRINSVDAYGGRLPQPLVGKFTDAAGKNWANHFKQGQPSATGIPFGLYRFKASDSDGLLASGTVQVNAVEVWFTVSLEGFPMESTAEITGDVQGFIEGLGGTDTERWCKLEGVYRQEQFESPLVTERAEFAFGPVPAGSYAMTCINHDEVLFMQPLRITMSSKPFRLKAPGSLKYAKDIAGRDR